MLIQSGSDTTQSNTVSARIFDSTADITNRVKCRHFIKRIDRHYKASRNRVVLRLAIVHRDSDRRCAAVV